MPFPPVSFGPGTPDLMNDLDAGTGVFHGEAPAVEDVFIDACMQVGEAAAELDLLFIDGDAAKGALSLGGDLFGQIIVIEAHKPADAGIIKLQVTASLILFIKVDNIFFNPSENPGEHIEKVHAYVGGHTT